MTHRQRECLDFIRAFQARHGGVSPTFREIKEALGLVSHSAVYGVIAKLKAAGKIHARPHSARDITIIDDIDLANVPLARLVAELERRQGNQSSVHAGANGR